MDDVLHSEIKDYCKIAMPEGLKELMSDISREVLRAQPQDIYKFITKYLAALLVTRENLSVASRICGNVCDSVYEPELEDELKYIGLAEEDVTSTCAIIMNYLKEGGENETNLIAKLITETGIKQTQVPALVQTVRRAFVRYQKNNTVIYETSSDSDEYSQAAHHTLDLYRKTKPMVEEYFQKAEMIQAAYRAYGVQRHCTKKMQTSDKQNGRKNIRFHDETDVRNFDASSTSDLTSNEMMINEIKPDKRSDNDNSCLTTVSSVSLAGSHLCLPMHKPYSIHSDCVELDEIPEKEEKEHVVIDYVTEEFKIDSQNVEYDKEFKNITEIDEQSRNVRTN